MMDFSLHEIFAKTMDMRLSYVKTIPQRILLALADGGYSFNLLHQRYPDAAIDLVENRDNWILAEKEAWKNKYNIWQRLRHKPPKLWQQNLTEPLPEKQFDYVWSNLCFPDEELLSVWSNCLKEDGLLFLSTFGTDTLCELSDFLQKPFTDLHDLGDLISRHTGWKEAITDADKIKLSYQNIEKLKQDIKILGLNKYLIEDEYIWDKIEELILSGRLQHITLEIIYAHAVKKQSLPENTAILHFYRNRPT